MEMFGLTVLYSLGSDICMLRVAGKEKNKNKSERTSKQTKNAHLWSTQSVAPSWAKSFVFPQAESCVPP